jgi:hypothetical protein
MLTLDSETFLAEPGRMAPPIVCLSWASPEGAGIFHAKDPGLVPFVQRGLFADSPIVGAHIAYDFAVLCAHAPRLTPVVWDAYDAGKVSDVLIREKLCDLRRGVGMKREYSLAAVAKRRLGLDVEKEGPWRRTYADLLDVPMDQWPPGAVRYAIDDAVITRDIWLHQEQNERTIADERAQAKYAWWLHLCTIWGITTDPMRVQSLKARYEAEKDTLRADLQKTGLVRENESRDIARIRARIEEAYQKRGLAAPRVDGNPLKSICYSADVCNLSGDPTLEKLGRWGEVSSKLNKDVNQMLSGLIHARYGIAESGRTTCSGVQVQNLPRDGGVRECYVPRPGYVFANADYDGLELRTIAQMCVDLLGHSNLADILNRGDDPHLVVAAAILGMTYEETRRIYKDKKHPRWKEVNQARQAGKVCNFGMPVGLGKDTLCEYARATYGVIIVPDQAVSLKKAWLQTLPEMNEFFDLARRQDGISRGKASFKQLRCGRERGGLSFTKWCSTISQGLGADAAKAAGYLISKECYDERCGSPLLGSRIVLFCHDEFLLEVPDTECAHDAATRMATLMCEGASTFLPDVPPTTEPALTRRYSKMTQTLKDDNGRLLAWDEK